MKSFPLTNIIALSRAWIFLRSPWAVQEEREIVSEHPIIFVKSFFPLLFSEIWWTELEKKCRMYWCCVYSIGGPWHFATFMSLILLLKEQSKPHCCARCSSFQENIVVDSGDKWSIPTAFASTAWLAFISRRKQTLREKSWRCVQHNSSFYINHTLVPVTLSLPCTYWWWVRRSKNLR